jgi:lipoprotein-releasing system ATP-binding protein
MKNHTDINKTPLLKAVNVSKEYRMGRQRLRVLKDVSLEIKAGSFLSIEGPSGAGKSTLLHLLGILDTPSEGHVFYRGKNLSGLTGRQQAYWRNKLFGFVFQFYHLLPDLNSLDNVALPALADAGILGWQNKRHIARSKALDLLDIVGLSERASHRPAQLSGGERQRVAIARALMNDPELLLCDEPTGNLDSNSGKKILDLLCKVREETGTTLVVVTHDHKVAAKAEEQTYMKDGRFVDNNNSSYT